jgi:hypothetical protein
MTREEERTANKGFAIAGVSCFADAFVQGGSSVLRMKFSANNPRHRKPQKRSQLKKQHQNQLILVLLFCVTKASTSPQMPSHHLPSPCRRS